MLNVLCIFNIDYNNAFIIYDIVIGMYTNVKYPWLLCAYETTFVSNQKYQYICKIAFYYKMSNILEVF